MRALDLDFANRPGAVRRGAYVLLAASLVAAGLLGRTYLDLSSDLTAWEAKWRSLQKTQRSETGPGARQKAESEQLQSELKAANRVIAQLSMPWDVLFKEVEASVDDQITLLSVEPDTEKRELRITAEAKNLAAMLDYMKRLRAIAAFRDAHVLNHQIQQQDPQRPIRFVITAQWLESLQAQAPKQPSVPPQAQPQLQAQPPAQVQSPAQAPSQAQPSGQTQPQAQPGKVLPQAQAQVPAQSSAGPQVPAQLQLQPSPILQPPPLQSQPLQPPAKPPVGAR